VFGFFFKNLIFFLTIRALQGLGSLTKAAGKAESNLAAMLYLIRSP